MTKAQKAAEEYASDEMMSGLAERSFKAGYERAEKDLGWISVKDRLPEEGHFVFTCSEDEGHPQCVGVSCLLKGQWWDGEDYLNVEYWMEIPKLPKEERK